MTVKGFDAAQDCSHVTAKAKAAGVGFVCRYLSRSPAKNLTAAEAAALAAAGIKMVLVWETTDNRALDGGDAGETDATQAASQAEALGVPYGTAIYFAVDFDASDPEIIQIAAGYAAGFRRGLGGKYVAGVYGNGAVCAYLLDHGPSGVAYAWLAGGSGMNGTKAFDASGRWHIKQHVGDKLGLALGINIDSDEARDGVEFGGFSLGPPTLPLGNVRPAGEDAIVGAVKTLQALLATRGLYPGAIDGIAGPQTLGALARFRVR